jgi:hypothetical protein
VLRLRLQFALLSGCRDYIRRAREGDGVRANGRTASEQRSVIVERFAVPGHPVDVRFCAVRTARRISHAILIAHDDFRHPHFTEIIQRVGQILVAVIIKSSFGDPLCSISEQLRRPAIRCSAIDASGMERTGRENEAGRFIFKVERRFLPCVRTRRRDVDAYVDSVSGRHGQIAMVMRLHGDVAITAPLDPEERFRRVARQRAAMIAVHVRFRAGLQDVAGAIRRPLAVHFLMRDVRRRPSVDRNPQRRTVDAFLRIRTVDRWKRFGDRPLTLNRCKAMLWNFHGHEPRRK